MRQFLMLGLLALSLLGCRDKLSPLTDSTLTHQAELPADVLLLNVTEAVSTGAFTVEGSIASFKEGDASQGELPTLRWSLQLPQPFQGDLWLRTRWADSCGNSLTVKLPGFPARVVGEDSVYGVWHWVKLDQAALPAGDTELIIEGREDGVAIDQLLLSADPHFIPRGQITPEGNMELEPRRFADDFNRSPGHGLDNWHILSGEWDIAFSFDPNRIPNQYSLTGSARQEAAAIRIGTADWSGLRVAFSIRPDAQTGFQVTLEDGNFGIPFESASLPDRWRADQWHRVVIERWGNLIQVSLDNHLIKTIERPPASGAIGFRLESGAVAIDDVKVEQIFWASLSDLAYRVEGEWFREAETDVVEGRSGKLILDGGKLPIYAVSLLAADGSKPAVDLQPPRQNASREHELPGGLLIDSGNWAEPTFALAAPAEQPVRIKQIYARLSSPAPAGRVEIGPYHFTSKQLFDPADYHDFTAEEEAIINSEEHREVLARRPRLFPVVGKNRLNSAWMIERGSWQVEGGVLTGSGQPAIIQHSHPLGLSFIFSGRVNLQTPDSDIELLRDGKSYPLVSAEQREQISASGWLPFRLAVPVTSEAAARDGIVRLQLTGQADLDDLLFSLPRREENEHLSIFAERETDWWREGGAWVDHAGIACVVASSWISLAAPDQAGRLIHKAALGPNLSLAFTIEEYSEWFGWKAKPSHAHHPFDNIQAFLLDAAGKELYRLEINAQDRTVSRLLRQGEPVAVIDQDQRFPLRYRGGHSPYVPRRARIYLSCQDGALTAAIDGQTILQFQDENPLPVANVALGGHTTHVNFTYIELRQLNR